MMEMLAVGLWLLGLPVGVWILLDAQKWHDKAQEKNLKLQIGGANPVFWFLFTVFIGGIITPIFYWISKHYFMICLKEGKERC